MAKRSVGPVKGYHLSSKDSLKMHHESNESQFCARPREGFRVLARIEAQKSSLRSYLLAVSGSATASPNAANKSLEPTAATFIVGDWFHCLM